MRNSLKLSALALAVALSSGAAFAAGNDGALGEQTPLQFNQSVQATSAVPVTGAVALANSFYAKPAHHAATTPGAIPAQVEDRAVGSVNAP
ncbi:MAG: hypothetical protein KGQ46_00920 [Hyphomicrobiales bacterium]|nr:hypothetical protein [Hyphomicrobiales bacterium]MDE2115503.1 hypothetical protein [Hyphomicrobiales bacterium]